MKQLTLPHWSMVAGSTGTLTIWERWRHVLQTSAGAPRDLEEWNEVAPSVLRDLRQQFQDHAGVPFPGQRVCHVGFPYGSDRPIAYEYDSDHDFEPITYD